MRNTLVVSEALESRTFLSASPASGVLGTAVQADQLQVRQDLLKFKSDAIGCTLTLFSDVNAVRADDLKGAKTLRPLVAKFRHDVGAMRTQLWMDRMTQAQNALADESVIVGIHKKMLLDKGNSTAEAADRSALLAERIKLQTDLVTGLTSRLNTRQNDTNTIFNDGQAIVTAAQSDPNASSQLQSALVKWAGDKGTCMGTMATDIQTLITDRNQLVTDLTAMQSQ
ncbi:MAG TPA: hypothetical protein VFC78_13765 [Tepidisphaeraceae bacterium]|nr:hypothetical protein [Tepidisphaeraceae bacterium]